MIVKFLLTVIFITFSANQTLADQSVMTFTQEIDQIFGGGQSPDEARTAGVAKGKSDALEKAGTYVESYTVVEDFIMKKDEVLALAAGVLKTEILSQRNYGTDNGFGMILNIKVEVDKSVLASRIEQIQTDKGLLHKYEELQNREAELLARIRELEKMSSKNSKAKSGDAIAEYRNTIQQLPAVELNRKALELWSKGHFTDPQAALDLLDQALALDGTNTATINNRGVALFQLGQKQNALLAFDKAIKLKTDYGDAYNNRGIFYLARQNYSKAEEDFSRVLEIMPMSVEAYINRAVARKHLLKHQLALEDYKRALVIDPHAGKQSGAKDSASLSYNELERICQKAVKACELGLCKSLDYLKSREFCQ